MFARHTTKPCRRAGGSWFSALRTFDLFHPFLTEGIRSDRFPAVRPLPQCTISAACCSSSCCCCFGCGGAGYWLWGIEGRPRQAFLEFLGDAVLVAHNAGFDIGFLKAACARLGIDWRHVDDHALWIDPDDVNYYLVGCDGGIYESFDRGRTWTALDSGYTGSFFTALTIDGDSIVAVGLRGSVYRSDDGGESFSRVETPVEVLLNEAALLPDGRIVVVCGRALSAVIDHSRGTQTMSEERRGRIEQAIEIMASWEPDPVLVRFVHTGTLTDPWLQEADFCREVTNSDPCAYAMDMFDREAEKLTQIFGAVRIASLEIANRYDPTVHNPWFTSFSWEAFSQDELRLVPTIIALGAADQVAGEGMRSFSRLLSSGRPVQILIRVQPHNNPGRVGGEGPFQSFRTELGYLGISHRQAMVEQSSAARHRHMLDCFLAALEATRTSLHVINTGQSEPGRLLPLNAWLVAGAAIESRAHPFFRIAPEAGDSSSTRMDFSGNPQWDRDWPVHPFRYHDENSGDTELQLAFTFADYCLLIERLRDHYRLIPPGCDSVSLIPMQDYLAMGAEQAYQHVPYVLAVDGNAILHRVVVSRELALASLDRLNYWRTLQEMAGVRNRHVDLAVEETRNLEHHLAAEECARLQARHAEELEQVRSQAAGEAMQRLADVLLGMELAPTVPAGAPLATAGAPAEEAPTEPSTPDELTVADEEELTFDEPWIDTALCTSCNDCLKVNAVVFLYNEEKQAYLGDLSKVSYVELVTAAELCPARCIHPGLPLNPNEAGLDELIERAAPFNQ